jgi:adenylate cyclase, class 1
LAAGGQQVDQNLIPQITRNINSFRIYNRYKIELCLRQCSEAQRDAFYLVPYLLHTSNPPHLGQVDGENAACGIYAYALGNSVQATYKKHFPKEDYDLRNTDKRAAIEFLALMGSVGTIAFSEKSDFDYWVCLREDLSSEQVRLLHKKCYNIEQWCEKELGVEVHFFTMTGQSLRDNNFGEVSKESCGSAQAKLLKEEYFRSSLLVQGKISLWWIVPAIGDDSYYKKTLALVSDNPDRFPDAMIDTGNLSDIPIGEFLGAGLWQLNKGINSPYKSVMKLALLLDYSSGQVNHDNWLAGELRRELQNNPSNLDDFDGYCRMMDRVLRYFSNGHPEDAHTLRVCFFIKIGVAVSLWMDQKKDPVHYHERMILKYVREWGWTRRQVEDLEHVQLLSVAKTLQLKRQIEMFMLRGLQELFRRVGPLGLKGVMSEMDQTRLLNRLLSVYDLRRDRIEWCYPPFDRCLQSKNYTIVRISTQKYRLYRGEVNVKSISNVDVKSFLMEDISLEKMAVWMIYNGLIHSKIGLISNLSRADDFARNVKSLASLYRRHFDRTHVPSLDGTFSKPSKPQAWIIAINLLPKSDRWLNGNSLEEEINVFKELFSRERLKNKPVFARKNTKDGFLTVPIERIEGVLKRLHVDQPLESDKLKPEDEFDDGPTTVTKIDTLEETVHEARMLLHPDEDVLNAWDREVNLCRDMFLIEKNSWSEVSVQSHSKEVGLMNILLVILQGSILGGMSLSHSVTIETGSADYDVKKMISRWQQLILDLETFFFCEEAQDPNVKSCFLITVGGRLFLLSKDKDQFAYQEFLNLSQATLEVNLGHRGPVRYFFDSGNRRWNFYQEAVKDCRKGQLQMYAQKGTRGSYIIVIDECGHMMTCEMSRDDLRLGLPRFVYSLGLCLRKMQDAGCVPYHQAFRVSWFQRDSKNQAYMEDITQKILKAVEATIPRMAEVEMVLPWSSSVYFLKHFSDYGIYRLDSDVVKHELGYITKQLDRLRKGEDPTRYYPIFFSEFQVINDSNELFLKNTCLWLQLKSHLEKACLKALSSGSNKNLKI